MACLNRLSNLCVLGLLSFASRTSASPSLNPPGAPPIEPGIVQATTHPLVARYSAFVPSQAKMRVEFGPDVHYGRMTWVRESPPAGGKIEMLVAGMKPVQLYHMRAVLEFPDGSVWKDADHEFTTGAPPAGRSPHVQTTRTGAPIAPGVEVLNLVPIPYPPPPAATVAGTPLNAVVYDLEGNLLWYYDYGTLALAQPLQQLATGNFLVTPVK